MLLNFNKTGKDIILPKNTPILDTDESKHTLIIQQDGVTFDLSNCIFVTVYDTASKSLISVIKAADPGEFAYLDEDNNTVDYTVVSLLTHDYVFDLKTFKIRTDLRSLSDTCSQRFYNIFNLTILKNTVLAVHHPFYDRYNESSDLLIVDANMTQFLSDNVTELGLNIPKSYPLSNTITVLNNYDQIGYVWDWMFDRCDENNDFIEKLKLECDWYEEHNGHPIEIGSRDMYHAFEELNKYQCTLGLWYLALRKTVNSKTTHSLDAPEVVDMRHNLHYAFVAYKQFRDNLQTLFQIQKENIYEAFKEYTQECFGVRSIRRVYWYEYNIQNSTEVDVRIATVSTKLNTTLIPKNITVAFNSDYLNRASYPFTRDQLIELDITDHWDSSISLTVQGEYRTAEYADAAKALSQALAVGLARCADNVKTMIYGEYVSGTYTATVKLGDETGTLTIGNNKGRFRNDDISFLVDLHHQSTALRMFLSLFTSIDN